MGEYNADTKDAINELKRRMENVVPNDLKENVDIFYRFLKARDFHIDNAEKMLREHLEWRKRIDIEKVVKMKHPEVLTKYLPYNKLGYDKDGCVVRYLPSGTVDVIGIVASCKLEDIDKYMICNYEEDMRDTKQCKQIGKSPHKVIYIHNLENYSFAQATDKKVILTLIHCFNMYMNQYPETLKCIFVINTTVYFSLMFSVLKKFLPEAVLQKVKIYSDDSYKEDLLKVIDADYLPKFLGGNRTDPDGNPLCKTFINHGGPVPEKYYIHRSKRSLANEPGVEKITLSRASYHEVMLEVKEPDSYLEWEFEIECRDTGFGLFYEDKDGNKTELVTLQRMNTDEYSESGIYKCENAGTYIILFDNTYSLIRSKTIYYKIKVLTSKEAESHLIE